MGNDQKPTCSSCIVIEPLTISKFCHSSYMVITLHNLKILLPMLWVSHPTVPKSYQPSTWNFFGLILSLNSFFRNCVSIIITITVLVSHNVICFGYFMSINYDFNKKAPLIVSHHPSLLPGFHQVYLLFHRKYFINLFLL